MNHRIILAVLFLLFAFFTHCGFAAEFLRRQAGTTTLTGTSTTVTIPTTLADMSKSILVFSTTSSSNNPRDYQVGGEITNTTTLTFVRNNNGGSVSISWEVIEFESGVYVQRGSDVVPLSTNVDITIECVDLNQSFVILSGINDGTTLGNDDGITGNLTSETNLRLLTGTTGGDFDQAYWQVIEYQGASVQKVTASLTGATATSTIPTPVDMSKTMIISSHIIGGNSNADDLPRTELTNSNTVTYTRVGTTNTMTFLTYVVEFTDQTTVARGTANFTSGSASQVVSGLTTTSSSAVIAPGNYGKQGSCDYTANDNTGHNWFTYDLTSSTTLQIDRAENTSNASAPWQIVTFENADDGLQKSTFYSIGSGDWESSAVWSYTPDGSSGAVPDGVYPGRDNNVVIQNGHSITIDDVTDNDPCSVSADGLGLGNVGPFTGSGDQMFYHTGDILVANGGSLSSSEEVMLAGYTLIENGGSFTATEDIINLGYLEVSATATFGSTLDDLILSGNSYTIIDNTSTTADDIYIDHTDAQLCGAGTVEIGNGGPNPVINWFNPGTSRFDQICDGFQITCSTNCTGGSTGTGTGGFSSGITGPGGVGTTDGTSSLEYWIDANSGVTGSSPITAWTDLSGNSVTNTVNGNPVLTTSSLNGQSVVTFDGTGDYIQTNLNINDGTHPELSIISVYVPASTTGAGSIWGESNGDYDRALTSGGGVGGCNYAVTSGTACLDDISLFPNSASVITSVIFDEDAASGSEVYTNGNSVITFTSNHSAAGTSNNMQIGDVGGGLSLPYTGDIAEVMVFSGVLNDAKRIIIENYLDAKYHNDAAPAFSNDVYTMDNSANGDYDFEVAGIGQASDGSNHKDAQGTGVLRMWNPDDLDNGEFLMWGHDNTSINATTTGDVDGTIIQERLTRVWGISEISGDVGTVSISFDFSGVGESPLGSNLRLLIDRDGDGFADNDVTPIEGSVSNGIAVFSNVNLQDGDLITLGNTDVSIPLPIELLEFEVFQEGENVVAKWTTVTELNNDFFTLERSGDGNNWIPILKLDGAGTTNQMQSYQAVDDQPIRGMVYYRLKQTDYDGQFSYSPVKMIEMQFINDIKIFPNPSNGVFKISGIESENVVFTVFNILGQQVPFSINEEEGIQIDLGNGPVGVYLVKVKDGHHVKTFQVIRK
ncbi:MAG: T9SS type A sorting domain-containing protein [Cyclobacteriaceae bacterium]